jgi:hypothetical protein
MRISRLFKRLRRWSSQAFRKRHSPAAFSTCRNAGNSVLTAEGTTSKGTGSISFEVEFCIFYRLSLRTLRTKDVCMNNINFSTLPVSLWLYSIQHAVGNHLIPHVSISPHRNRSGIFGGIIGSAFFPRIEYFGSPFTLHII